MKNDALYESILGRLLTEAEGGPPDTTNLALQVTVRDNGYFILVLYDTSVFTKEVQKALASMSNQKKKNKYPLTIVNHEKMVRGYAQIGPTTEPCNKAWSVKNMAGPGYGKIMYGACYALSPSKKLMPDRYSVTQVAGNAWKKAFQSDRPKEPLDDITNQKTRKKSDNCVAHVPNDMDCDSRSRPWLNYSYSAEGWELPMLKTLRAAHENNMKLLPKSEREFFEADLKTAGSGFFVTTYSRSL